MNPPIYLDMAATTPVDPQVADLMCGALKSFAANPNSQHQFGRRANKLLSDSREEVASYLGVSPQEIIFTSGATESLNLAIIGGARAMKGPGHVITSLAEHSAVLKTVAHLRDRRGWEADYLPTGEKGALSVEEVEAAIKPNTQLCTIMAANNETGVITDILPIAQLLYEKGIPLIVDAVALYGKAPLPQHPGISALAISGHKFHGPPGISALVVKKDFTICSRIMGGGQEWNKRAGTPNLPAIQGLALAMRLVEENLEAHISDMKKLQTHMEKRLLDEIPGTHIHGLLPRTPAISNVGFEKADGETLLIALDQAGIAVSHGSACSAGASEPSRILINMGIPYKEAQRSIRISLSYTTTLEEIDHFVDTLKALV